MSMLFFVKKEKRFQKDSDFSMKQFYLNTLLFLDSKEYMADFFFNDIL